MDTVLLSMVVRYYGPENTRSKHQRPVLAARLDHAHRPPCRRPHLTITRPLRGTPSSCGGVAPCGEYAYEAACERLSMPEDAADVP